MWLINTIGTGRQEDVPLQSCEVPCLSCLSFLFNLPATPHHFSIRSPHVCFEFFIRLLLALPELPSGCLPVFPRSCFDQCLVVVPCPLLISSQYHPPMERIPFPVDLWDVSAACYRRAHIILSYTQCPVLTYLLLSLRPTLQVAPTYSGYCHPCHLMAPNSTFLLSILCFHV